MGDVVCFKTGETIESYAPNFNMENVKTVIESLYQRKEQIDCIIVMGLSSITADPVFLCAASEYERRLLWTYFLDYMRDLSEEFEDD